jgi:hypothetical protein
VGKRRYRDNREGANAKSALLNVLSRLRLPPR